MDDDDRELRAGTPRSRLCLLNPYLLQAAAVGAGREGHGEARAGEGAGVLGGTARQSSGDFLLVGRRGRGARKRRKISEIWANGGVCRVRRVGGDHQVVGGGS